MRHSEQCRHLPNNLAALAVAVDVTLGDLNSLVATAADLAAKLAAAVTPSGVDPVAVEQAAVDAKSLADKLTAAHAALTAAAPPPSG